MSNSSPLYFWGSVQKLFLFAALFVSLVSCKEDQPDPIPAVKSIVGKWRPIEHSKDGGVTNIPVPNGAIDLLIFRFDGVILNEAGYRPCCSPTSFILNGELLEIKPQATIELDPTCASVLCTPCDEIKITVKSENDLVAEYCNGNQTKFVRDNK